MRGRLFLAAAILAGSGPGLRATERLSFSDLHYLGAFRVPKIASPAGDVGTINYGGESLGYHPGTPGSLFIGCFAPAATIAEISIPEPSLAASVSDLPTATLLQPCTDPTTGGAVSAGNDVNGYRIGGMMVSGGRLIVSKYAYYDANGSQTNAFFVKPNTDLSQANAQGAFAIGNAPNIGFVDGWLAPVPAAWQAALKGPILTGNDSIAIVGRTSSGPDAFSWDPALLVDPAVAVPSTPLFYYPLSHPTLGAWGNQNPIDNVTNFWNGSGSGYHGAVLPDGTSSLLFFGAQGMDPNGFCYGEGTSDRSLDRQPVPGTGGEVVYCYDPANDSKGTHGYPYQYQIMAYDVNDVAAVMSGTKQPWDLVPYAVWPLVNGFVGLDGINNEVAGGAVYDPVSKRIYFSAPAVDQVETYSSLPVIYVWQVGTPGSGDTTPPAAPRGLMATPGDGRATLRWSPNAESDVGGYNVYRAAAAGGPYAKQNTAWLSAAPFTQAGLTNGADYWYAVTAVDTAGNESPKSDPARVTPGAAPGQDLSTLNNLIDPDHPEAIVACAGGEVPRVLDRRGREVQSNLPSVGPNRFAWDGHVPSGRAASGEYVVTCGHARTRVIVAR